MSNSDPIRPVEWRDSALYLLDQLVLPEYLSFIRHEKVKDVTHSIKTMLVRGAPAIGCAAAYGYVLAQKENDPDAAVRELREARPTAVNLAWAIDRMDAAKKIGKSLLLEANRILAEDIAACKMMGSIGSDLIDPASYVLTHCNAGALATGGYGTALGVIRTAWEQKKLVQVFASETRPRQQGIKLTAWELSHDGIEVEVVPDTGICALMGDGLVDYVITGADRIAANGDVINKIGTQQLAVLAHHYGIPVMVVAPRSTVDLDSPTGQSVLIEHRSPKEVYKGREMPGVTFRNQAFDITPAKLIDCIVTETGIHDPQNLQATTGKVPAR